MESGLVRGRDSIYIVSAQRNAEKRHIDLSNEVS